MSQQDGLAKLYWLLDRFTEKIAMLEALSERLDRWERRSERIEMLLVELQQSVDRNATVAKTERALIQQYIVSGDSHSATIGDSAKVGQVAAGKDVSQQRE